MADAAPFRIPRPEEVIGPEPVPAYCGILRGGVYHCRLERLAQAGDPNVQRDGEGFRIPGLGRIQLIERLPQPPARGTLSCREIGHG